MSTRTIRRAVPSTSNQLHRYSKRCGEVQRVSRACLLTALESCSRSAARSVIDKAVARYLLRRYMRDLAERRHCATSQAASMGFVFKARTRFGCLSTAHLRVQARDPPLNRYPPPEPLSGGRIRKQSRTLMMFTYSAELEHCRTVVPELAWDPAKTVVTLATKVPTDRSAGSRHAYWNVATCNAKRAADNMPQRAPQRRSRSAAAMLPPHKPLGGSTDPELEPSRPWETRNHALRWLTIASASAPHRRITQ